MIKSNLYQDQWPKSFGDGPTLEDVSSSDLFLTTDEKVELIKEIVCDYRKTTFDKINIVCRKREVVLVRHEIMYFLGIYTNLTLEGIGNVFDQTFDHTTVIHAKKTIEDLRFSDKEFRSSNDKLNSLLILNNV